MVRALPVLGVMLAGTLLSVVGGCTDETQLTDEERDLLATFRLPDKPPPNPSNGVADDPRAAALGHKFFFESRFSGALGPQNDGVSNGSLGMAGETGKVSCYSCHQLETGGSDHRSRPMATSLGVNYGLRNSPTVFNVVYSDITKGGWQLWDGRKDSLWAQAVGPMEGANEHNGTRLQFAHIIYDYYRAEYEAIFGAMPDLSDTARFPLAGKPGKPEFDNMAADDKVAINRVHTNLGKLIEAYERTLISTNFQPSPFDRFLAGDETAMSPSALRGARLFIGKAACNECHNGPTFTDYKFHNIGCPQEGQNVPATDNGRKKAFAIVKADAFNRASIYSDFQDDSHIVAFPEGDDAVAKEDGKFKTPGLRNIAKTGPYMHDGVYENLWDVINHYNFGGGTGTYAGAKEPAIAPLLLSQQELDDLVEFLRALSDGDPLDPALIAKPDLPQ